MQIISAVVPGLRFIEHINQLYWLWKIVNNLTKEMANKKSNHFGYLKLMKTKQFEMRIPLQASPQFVLHNHLRKPKRAFNFNRHLMCV